MSEPIDPATRIELQDVMLRYACGVDERDFDLYRGCFADDAVIVGFGKDAVTGGDAWTEYVVGALEPYVATQHMLGPQLASMDEDGETARCRTDVQAWHRFREPEGRTLTLWATYRTDMRRVDGAWKIVRHELVPRGTRTVTP